MTSTLSTSEQTFIVGGASDTWGRTWTASNLSNTNFRLRLTNTSLNTGPLELSISKPAAQVLTVPGSITLTNMGPGAAEQLFLIKPPANGLYQVALAATNVQAGVEVTPRRPARSLTPSA